MENISISDLVEVTLDNADAFLKIRETLTRIGVSARRENRLFQSCHILHKRGKYYIVHFKELFALDGKESNISINDLARRNKIARLLEEWNLCSIVRPEQVKEPLANVSQIKILSFADKDSWELCPKYNIGRKTPRRTDYEPGQTVFQD